MRIKRTLYNSMYAIASYFLIAILGLVMRKVFLVYLSTDYLGFEGFFGDLFTILSVGELGIAGIIQYKIYKAIAEDNHDDERRIMAMYKLLYRIVGFSILAIGLLIIPFFRFFIKGNSLEWRSVYIIYGLQLTAAICNYFLAYKRIMIVAHLREAEITKIETGCTILGYVVKIVIIFIFNSYLMYLAVGILNNILANYIIARKVDKEYPYIKERVKITRDDIKELQIGKDLKNNVVQKISMAIYSGTDSILITSLIGIAQTGLVSNYTLIIGQVSRVLTKLLDPFQAAIANFIHSEGAGEHDDMFHMFDRISFFMACFISTSFFVLFNPFISLMFGEKFLMPVAYVVAIVSNQYITYNHKFLSYYRGAFGKFELDKPYIVTAAILNLTMSIILAKPLGVAGIMLGTSIGHMGFWIGRARVVYSEYVKESIAKYILRQIINLAICVAEMGLTFYACTFFSNDLPGFILKALMCVLIPNVANLIIFAGSNDMKTIMIYVKKSIAVVKNKEA